MKIISLNDNRLTEWNAAWTTEKDGEMPSFEDSLKNRLENINEKSIMDLASHAENNDKFVVFPSKSAKSELNKKDNFIFKLTNRTKGNPSFQTGNIMGFIGLGDDVQMQITSRFDEIKNEDGVGKNFFLHYMLQKVCNVAFVPKTGSAEEQIFDFLYYLFPGYLKAACKQGIYRAYVTREYNDSNVRGPIDVARHIRCNMPFNGKIAYHTREYTTDNKITQLVRHTIEYIRTLKYGGAVLGTNDDVRDDVNDIVAATPTYSKNLRMQVISQNLHPVTHPYYTAYEPLRKLCLAILLHKKLSYGKSDNQPITGILFDGASLWEEYLAKVFEKHKLGLIHSNNRENQKGIKIFKGGHDYYPDFYREKTSENAEDALVFDAKYKQLCTIDGEISDESSDDSSVKKNGVSFHYKREDLFQMLSYMHCLKAQKAVLISPYKDKERKGVIQTPDSPKEALGYGGKISIIAVPIPAYDSDTEWEKFKKEMENVEENLYKVCCKMVARS